MCTTISPALPYALFDRSVSNASEVEQYNGNVVFEGIIDCAKAALEQDIPVVLGNDVGCPWITQYDFWRELVLLHKYVGVSNASRCTPPPAAAPSWRVSVRRPARWSRERRRTSSLRRRIHWPTYGRCAM